MTVRELIAHLETMPQDFLVAYRCCSDSMKMEADDILIFPASKKKVVQHHNMPDRIRDYNDWEYKDGSEPRFLDVIMFPGN